MKYLSKTTKVFVILMTVNFLCQVYAETKYRFNEETARKYLRDEYELPSFEKAKKDAEAGDVYAQTYLGDLYNSGRGVTKDTEKAIYWYRKALEKGDNRAPFVLATMHELGNTTVRKLFKNDVSLYYISAERGYMLAQERLGSAYADGKGVPKDYIEAYAWWNVAAAQGADDAAANRDKLSISMSKSQIEKAQSLSREYYKKYVKNNPK